MSDDEQAVDRFLEAAETVYAEYENGYMDADAALSLLETHIEELRENAQE